MGREILRCAQNDRANLTTFKSPCWNQSLLDNVCRICDSYDARDEITIQARSEVGSCLRLGSLCVSGSGRGKCWMTTRHTVAATILSMYADWRARYEG